MRLDEAIKSMRETRSTSEQSFTRTRYDIQAKGVLLKAIVSEQITKADACRQIGFRPQTLHKMVMIYKNKLSVSSVEHGKNGVRITVATKIDAAEAVLHYGKSHEEVARAVNISYQQLSVWIRDYNNDLYNLNNVTQISRKKVKTYEVLLGEFKGLEQQLASKKNEVKEALERQHREELAELEAM